MTKRAADRPPVESRPLSASLLTRALEWSNSQYLNAAEGRTEASTAEVRAARQRFEEYLTVVDALEAERDRLLTVEKAARLWYLNDTGSPTVVGYDDRGDPIVGENPYRAALRDALDAAVNAQEQTHEKEGGNDG